MVSKLVQFLHYNYLLTIIRNDHDFTLNTPHKFEYYKIRNMERGTGNREQAMETSDVIIHSLFCSCFQFSISTYARYPAPFS